MKKLHLAVLALSFWTATAFTHGPAATTAPTGPLKNFVYLAYPSENPIDLNNPENYELTAGDGTEVPLCSGFVYRCAVEAEDDGTGHPDFTRPYYIRTRS